MVPLYAFLLNLNPDYDNIFPYYHRIALVLILFTGFLKKIINCSTPPQTVLFGNKGPSVPSSDSVIVMWRINLFQQYNISLSALSFIFILDCLSLYVSGLFPFDSFKNLFLTTESFQFSRMRFCLLFLPQHIMFIMRLTSLFFGSKVSWTFSLRHFYFPSCLCGSVLWKLFIGCSPLSFSLSYFPTSASRKVWFFSFFTRWYQKSLLLVWSKNYKALALFRSLHMFISKWIVLEEVPFLHEACPELYLFKKNTSI